MMRRLLPWLMAVFAGTASASEFEWPSPLRAADFNSVVRRCAARAPDRSSLVRLLRETTAHRWDENALHILDIDVDGDGVCEFMVAPRRAEAIHALVQRSADGFALLGVFPFAGFEAYAPAGGYLQLGFGEQPMYMKGAEISELWRYDVNLGEYTRHFVATRSAREENLVGERTYAGGQIDAAGVLFRNAFHRSPSLHRALANLTLVNTKLQQDDELAANAYTLFAEVNAEPGLLATTLFNLGIAAEERGELRKAYVYYAAAEQAEHHEDRASAVERLREHAPADLTDVMHDLPYRTVRWDGAEAVFLEGSWSNAVVHDMAFHGNALWVATDRGLLRSDDASDRWLALDTVGALPSPIVERLFAGEGGLVARFRNGTKRRNFLLDERAVKWRELAVRSDALAWSGSLLWHADEHGVSYLDKDGEPGRRYPYPPALAGLNPDPRQLIVDGNVVWLVANVPEKPNSSGGEETRLFRFSLVTNRIDEVGRGASAFRRISYVQLSHGALWVSHRTSWPDTGALSRVDPESLAIETIANGASFGDIASGTDGLWFRRDHNACLYVPEQGICRPAFPGDADLPGVVAGIAGNGETVWLATRPREVIRGANVPVLSGNTAFIRLHTSSAHEIVLIHVNRNAAALITLSAGGLFLILACVYRRRWKLTGAVAGGAMMLSIGVLVGGLEDFDDSVGRSLYPTEHTPVDTIVGWARDRNNGVDVLDVRVTSATASTSDIEVRYRYDGSHGDIRASVAGTRNGLLREFAYAPPRIAAGETTFRTRLTYSGDATSICTDGILVEFQQPGSWQQLHLAEFELPRRWFRPGTSFLERFLAKLVPCGEH